MENRLLTSRLSEAFEKYPLYSTEALPVKEKRLIAKFECPFMKDFVWYIVEGQKEDNDYTMFGYCCLGNKDWAEFGYVTLNELEQAKKDVKIEGLGTLLNVPVVHEAPEYVGMNFIEAMRKDNFPIKEWWMEDIKEELDSEMEI